MINVALDLFLMGYCRMGTLGAAVATTAAQGYPSCQRCSIC